MAKWFQRWVEGREGGGAHLFYFCSRTVAQRRRARTRECRDRGAVHAASQLPVFADAQKLHKAAQASSLSRWLARGASPAAKMRIMRAWTSLGSCANAVSRRANAAAMRSMAGSRKGSSGAALVCSPRGAAGEIGDVERARLLKEPGAGRAWRGPAPACDARSPGPCAATAARCAATATQPLRPSCAAAAAPSLSTALAATAASAPRPLITGIPKLGQLWKRGSFVQCTPRAARLGPKWLIVYAEANRATLSTLIPCCCAD